MDAYAHVSYPLRLKLMSLPLARCGPILQCFDQLSVIEAHHRHLPCLPATESMESSRKTGDRHA